MIRARLMEMPFFHCGQKVAYWPRLRDDIDTRIVAEDGDLQLRW